MWLVPFAHEVNIEMQKVAQKDNPPVNESQYQLTKLDTIR
jgi:hypothetical protein